jgi:sugar phosphate isomerase/epimerase
MAALSANHSLSDRLGVCSWSLQPATPQELVARLQATGIGRIQLALDPLRENPSEWESGLELFRQENITILSGMFGCKGEDYSTLKSIRLTGGIAPDHTWAENWRNIQTTVQIARRLSLGLVTFHAGFLPHDPNAPDFSKMVQRLGEVADAFRAADIILGLETGQETAPDLVQLLQALKRPNVGVNFDPANMLLYDKGDPIEALRILGSWIRQVHIKDANRTRNPGTWGEEVPVGTGQVDWHAFFSALNQIDFTGNLVIEREAGNQRVADICKAKEFAQTLSR